MICPVVSAGASEGLIADAPSDLIHFDRARFPGPCELPWAGAGRPASQPVNPAGQAHRRQQLPRQRQAPQPGAQQAVG